MRGRLWLFLLASAVSFAQEASGKPDEGLEMWRWINFAILAAGLLYLLGKNLPSFFRDRTSLIQKEIAEAQKLKQESEQKAAAILKRVSTLGADIEAFRVQSLAEIQQEGERIKAEAAAHIAKLRDHAQGEIESAGKTASRELRGYAANLAVDLAGQRIQGRLNSDVEGGLVSHFLQDLKGHALKSGESKN